MEQAGTIAARLLKNGIKISSNPTATTPLRGSYDLPAEEIKRHRDEIADIERAQERCKGCTGEVCKQPSQGMIPVVEVHDGRFCYALRRCRHERNRLARLRISRLFASARIPRAYEGDTFADYAVTAANRDAVDAAHMMVADEIKGLFLHGEKGTGKTSLRPSSQTSVQGRESPYSLPRCLTSWRTSAHRSTAVRQRRRCGR